MPEPREKPKKERKEEAPPRVGLPLCRPGKPTCELADDVAVLLSAKAMQDLFGYAYATDNEISCLGTVKRRGNVFCIAHLYLLKQTGSFGHTEMDQTSVAELMEQLISEGKTEEAKSLKCWVHSHPGGMGVFWSQTDNETCRRLVSDYLVSIVVGEGYRAKCRIDVATPIAFAADDIPLFYEMPAETTKDYKALVKEKVHSELFLLRGPKGKPELEVVEQCPYCGDQHSPDYCPFMEETALYGDWEYGRF